MGRWLLSIPFLLRSYDEGVRERREGRREDGKKSVGIAAVAWEKGGNERQQSKTKMHCHLSVEIQINNIIFRGT